jgi:hypothetical protein
MNMSAKEITEEIPGNRTPTMATGMEKRVKRSQGML